MNDRSSITSPPNLSTTNFPQRPPKLLLVFNLGGMEARAISADTAEEEAELEKRFQRILPGLDAVNRIWQQDG